MHVSLSSAPITNAGLCDQFYRMIEASSDAGPMAHCEIQLLTSQVPLEVRHLAIAVQTTALPAVEGYPCLRPTQPLPLSNAFHVPGFNVEVHLANALSDKSPPSNVGIALPEGEVKKLGTIQRHTERQHPPGSPTLNLQMRPPIIPCVRWSTAPSEFQLGDPVSFAQELNTLVTSVPCQIFAT